MSKRRKNTNRHKHNSYNYSARKIKDPRQVKQIALEVFGSLYYSPKQDSI